MPKKTPSRDVTGSGALDGALGAIAGVLVDQAGARRAEIVLYVPDPMSVVRVSRGGPVADGEHGTLVPLVWQDLRIGHAELHATNGAEASRFTRVLEGALPLLAARRELELLRRELDRERTILTAVLDTVPLAVSVTDAETGEILVTNEAHDTRPPDMDLAAVSIDAGGTRLIVQRQVAPPQDDAVLRAQTGEREAQRDSAMKSSFLEAMSHELRTPLNAILGLGELLASSDLDTSQRHLVETLRTSGGTLLGMLNDILDYVRLQGGNLRLRDEDVPVLDVVEDIVSTLTPQARQRHLGLWLSVEALTPRRARTDPHRFAQIVQQLVRRGLLSTAAGQVHVHLGPRVLDDGTPGLRLTVKDLGHAWTEAEGQGLFEPFSAGPSHGEGTGSDTGLGLAVCRNLAAAMGGALMVVEGTGPGTTLALDLPLGLHADPLPPMRGRVSLTHTDPAYRSVLAGMLAGWGLQVSVARQDPAPVDLRITHQQVPLSADDPPCLRLGDDRDHEPDLPSYPLPSALHRGVADALASRPPPSSRRPSTTLTELRVLIVEDNAVNRLVARRMLTTLGCKVAVAEGGHEAIEHLRHDVPDVVLMDCHMPDLDGWATTRAIRKLGGLAATVPIIAVTASSADEVRERCFAEGMTGFLSKPISLASLSAALRSEPPRGGNTP